MAVDGVLAHDERPAISWLLNPRAVSVVSVLADRAAASSFISARARCASRCACIPSSASWATRAGAPRKAGRARVLVLFGPVPLTWVPSADQVNQVRPATRLDARLAIPPCRSCTMWVRQCGGSR